MIEGAENNNVMEDLKSIWKSQEEIKSYKSSDIFKMLKRKSVNSVQWLFIISLLEMGLGILLTVWPLIFGYEGLSSQSTDILGAEDVDYFRTVSIYGLIYSLFLIVIIFYFYRKISSDLSVSKLIKYIISFRNWVIGYIITGITLMLIIILPIYYRIGKQLFIQNATERNLPTRKIEELGNYGGWMVTFVLAAVVILSTLVYYFIIYGYFLRRLKKNSKELKKLED